jgi:asparagine synthase (glutamine-hydrolysing)
MCGIAGVLGEGAEPNLSQALQNMLYHMQHRGPDGEGSWHRCIKNTHIYLGHRRLAIVDLHPRSAQPMVSHTQRHVIVFNGEIYNYASLRSELASLGYLFKTTSDTEVLLHAWEHWGMACLSKLRGMFAFAVWDNKDQKLHLIRDHAGIKPLYYCHTPSQVFSFASEVKPLLYNLSSKHTQINRDGLASYLAYGSFQEPLTLYQGIYSVPSGCVLTYTPLNQQTQIQRYWFFPTVKPSLSISQTDIEELDHLLTQSLQRHLVSDVPLAVFLSSGIDSTVIAAYAQSIQQQGLKAFTIGFQDSAAHNEETQAQQTALRLKIPYQACMLSPEESIQHVYNHLNHTDLPSMDGLNVSTLSSILRQHGYKAALSGQGADEIFGGYPSFKDVPLIKKMLYLVQKYPKKSSLYLLSFLKPWISETHFYKYTDILTATKTLKDIYLQRRRSLSNYHLHLLGFKHSELNLTDAFIPFSQDDFLQENTSDPVSSVARLEYTHYLQSTLLRDSDQQSMASSIELRVPFLDQDIVQWCFSKPGHFLYHHSEHKRVLKKTTQIFLSQKQLFSPKKGFVFPLNIWMQTFLKDLCFESVTHLHTANILPQKGLDFIQNQFHKDPSSPAWSRYWSLVSLGFWLSKQKQTTYHSHKMAC